MYMSHVYKCMFFFCLISSLYVCICVIYMYTILNKIKLCYVNCIHPEERTKETLSAMLANSIVCWDRCRVHLGLLPPTHRKRNPRTVLLSWSTADTCSSLPSLVQIISSAMGKMGTSMWVGITKQSGSVMRKLLPSKL